MPECERHDVDHDVYRSGALIEAFERQAAALRAHPHIPVNPAAPQATTLHLHLHLPLPLPLGRERALALRDTLAREHGIWMFNRAVHRVLHATSVVEIYVGDNLLDMPDATVVAAPQRLADGCRDMS